MSEHQNLDLKTPEPDRFDGTSPPVHHFLNQLKIRFRVQAEKFSTEEAKVMYLLALLKGPAFEWASALMDGNDPMLENYETLTRALVAIFEEPDRMQSALNKISNLKQGTDSVAVYATKFKQLATWAGCDERHLVHQFRLGLSGAVKDELAARDLPTSLLEMMTLATRIDHRLEERARERASEQAPSARYPLLPPNNNPMAMEIDAARRTAPYSQEWTCHYCHKPGHFIAACRKRIAKEGLKEKGQSQK